VLVGVIRKGQHDFAHAADDFANIVFFVVARCNDTDTFHVVKRRANPYRNMRGPHF
jgi:hypothetical protein